MKCVKAVRSELERREEKSGENGGERGGGGHEYGRAVWTVTETRVIFAVLSLVCDSSQRSIHNLQLPNSELQILNSKLTACSHISANGERKRVRAREIEREREQKKNSELRMQFDKFICNGCSMSISMSMSMNTSTRL